MAKLFGWLCDHKDWIAGLVVLTMIAVAVFLVAQYDNQHQCSNQQQYVTATQRIDSGQYITTEVEKQSCGR